MTTIEKEIPIVFAAVQPVENAVDGDAHPVAVAEVPVGHAQNVSTAEMPASTSVRTEDNDMTEEETDSFPTGESNVSTLLVDRESLLRIAENSAAGPPSVALTELASAVGSVVRPPKRAFLKSITFYKDKPPMGWGIQFCDSTTVEKKKKNKLYIQSVEGIFSLSRIEHGDYLKSINKKKVGPDFNAESALECMSKSLNDEGFLSVAVGDKENGDDILIQATVIKPKPEMTCKQLGLVVWYWGYLCIKSIEKESIFKHTVLKSTDHIVSVNGIDSNSMSAEQFAQVIEALPLEITLTVLRRKQRFTGKFG